MFNLFPPYNSGDDEHSSEYEQDDDLYGTYNDDYDPWEGVSPEDRAKQEAEMATILAKSKLQQEKWTISGIVLNDGFRLSSLPGDHTLPEIISIDNLIDSKCALQSLHPQIVMPYVLNALKAKHRVEELVVYVFNLLRLLPKRPESHYGHTSREFLTQLVDTAQQQSAAEGESGQWGWGVGRGGESINPYSPQWHGYWKSGSNNSIAQLEIYDLIMNNFLPILLVEIKSTDTTAKFASLCLACCMFFGHIPEVPAVVSEQIARVFQERETTTKEVGYEEAEDFRLAALLLSAVVLSVDGFTTDVCWRQLHAAFSKTVSNANGEAKENKPTEENASKKQIISPNGLITYCGSEILLKFVSVTGLVVCTNEIVDEATIEFIHNMTVGNTITFCFHHPVSCRDEVVEPLTLEIDVMAPWAFMPPIVMLLIDNMDRINDQRLSLLMKDLSLHNIRLGKCKRPQYDRDPPSSSCIRSILSIVFKDHMPWDESGIYHPCGTYVQRTIGSLSSFQIEILKSLTEMKELWGDTEISPNSGNLLVSDLVTNGLATYCKRSDMISFLGGN